MVSRNEALVPIVVKTRAVRRVTACSVCHHWITATTAHVAIELEKLATLARVCGPCAQIATDGEIAKAGREVIRLESFRGAD